MVHSPAHALPAISRTRLECLFDGIFAIAMTLLVLDLKVPDLKDPHSSAELARELSKYTATYGSYALSFIVLGGMWYRHNHHCHHFKIITRFMLYCHLVQLAMAALFPFCAALVGRYPSNSMANSVYVGCIFFYLWASLVNWLAAGHAGALTPETTPLDFRRGRNRLLRSCLVVSVIFGFVVFRSLGS